MRRELATSAPSPIDPLADVPPGEYHDELVSVLRTPADAEQDDAPPIVRTEHFRLGRDGKRMQVRHALSPHELDNDVARLLVDELFAPGWLSGNEVFERVFTGVVRSTVNDPLLSWNIFYDNTLCRVREVWEDADAGGQAGDSGHSSIADIAPVYQRVLQLVPDGNVVDLGSCFGFLALLLAERPRNSVTASDLVPGTVNLLRAIARDRHVPLQTLVCDAAWVPLPDGAADTVTVIHLLEHLDREQGDAVLSEALRLATRRIVIAVPFESTPNAAYGHLRLFDMTTLSQLGLSTGHRFTISEYHGGWLVIDKDG
jgi:SAM-dependent methyltransferase